MKSSKRRAKGTTEPAEQPFSASAGLPYTAVASPESAIEIWLDLMEVVEALSPELPAPPPKYRGICRI